MNPCQSPKTSPAKSLLATLLASCFLFQIGCSGNLVATPNGDKVEVTAKVDIGADDIAAATSILGSLSGSNGVVEGAPEANPGAPASGATVVSEDDPQATESETTSNTGSNTTNTTATTVQTTGVGVEGSSSTNSST